jgi:hypothetical protein
MADVYTYQLTTGLVVPDTAEIQTDVQAEYSNTFGTDLNVTSPSTPQGLLINAETQARVAVVDNNAALANQINPSFAGGVFLDALLGFMGAQRIPASNSRVNCTIVGSFGTIIPVGSLAVDVANNQWETLETVTIPLSGTLTDVIFSAVDTGAITVTATQLNKIVSNLLGWDTVSNPASNYLTGVATQSDAQARQYRINTLYLQSNGLAGSVISALTALVGVKSLSFLENTVASTQTIKGVVMTANSIYVCIEGGNNGDVAACLTATKSAGCGYSNSASGTPVSYPYVVPLSGQTINVLFDRPDIIQIGVELTVILNTPIQDYITTLTQAILDYAAGQVSGLAGLKVGGNVSPFEIAAAVGIQYPGAYVTNLLISNLTPVIMNGTTTSGSKSISGLVNVLVSLEVGMSVSGAGIALGSVITALVDNTHVLISINATASATVSLTFTGNYGAQEIGIEPWQLANIASGNITVSLA